MISQNELKELLSYDPITGLFTWCVNAPFRKCKGEIAGCKQTNSMWGKSYIRICINRKLYAAHRLAWLYVHGQFPEDQIDHVNGNGTDNRIANLRVVSNQQNGMNRRLSSNNKSGCTGVIWNDKRGVWQAQIKQGKQINLGYFDNLLDAACARKSMENRLEFHKNHGSIRPL